MPVISNDRIFAIALRPELHPSCHLVEWESSSPVAKVHEKEEDLCVHYKESSGPDDVGDYWVVNKEYGTGPDLLPVWTARPGVIKMDEEYDYDNLVTREDVPGAEILNAFLLSNVLTSKECDQIVQMAETMGFTSDAPVSLGRDIRRNNNCVWVADEPTLNRIIFDRAKKFLPQSVESILPEQPPNLPEGTKLYRKFAGKPMGINQRWRFYRYSEGDTFKAHYDGAWVGSGLSNDLKHLISDQYHGQQYSWLTFLIYLNDGAVGGHTKFFLPSTTDQKYPIDIIGVTPKKGSVLCFWHGEHPMSPIHEAELIAKGVKYVIRTEILFDMTEGMSLVARDANGKIVEV